MQQLIREIVRQGFNFIPRFLLVLLKVGRVFLMVVVSMLLHAEIGRNGHRENAPHFIRLIEHQFENLTKSGEFKYYGILDDTYPIWKRNDIYLSYNLDNKIDWVVTKGNIYGSTSYQMWFYLRTQGRIPILFPKIV